jgi:hypothetical protein
MRFTKAEVLRTFEREETSYRLAYLCTLWLRNTANFVPSAADKARGLHMKARGEWISYADLAEKLQKDPDRNIIVSDFNLTHLHTLIRAPLEVLRDYCEDYDAEVPEARLYATLKATGWYLFATLIRNAVSHNYRYEFSNGTRQMLPLTWNGFALTQDLQGKPIDYETFWYKGGYELFLEMKDFATTLPERAEV